MHHSKEQEKLDTMVSFSLGRTPKSPAKPFKIHFPSCIYRVLNNQYAPPSGPYEKIAPPTILYQMKAREKLHLGVQLEKVQFVK